MTAPWWPSVIIAAFIFGRLAASAVARIVHAHRAAKEARDQEDEEWVRLLRTMPAVRAQLRNDMEGDRS